MSSVVTSLSFTMARVGAAGDAAHVCHSTTLTMRTQVTLRRKAFHGCRPRLGLGSNSQFLGVIMRTYRGVVSAGDCDLSAAGRDNLPTCRSLFYDASLARGPRVVLMTSCSGTLKHLRGTRTRFSCGANLSHDLVRSCLIIGSKRARCFRRIRNCGAGAMLRIFRGESPHLRRAFVGPNILGIKAARPRHAGLGLKKCPRVGFHPLAFSRVS